MNTLSPRVNFYTIYALVDPRNNAVRYIGMTYDVYQRMRQHSRCSGNNQAKNAWIQELQKEQLMFSLHSLQAVETLEEALICEQRWIRYYLQQGADLTNIAGRGTRMIEGKLTADVAIDSADPSFQLEGYRVYPEQSLEVAIGGHWIAGHVRLVRFRIQVKTESATTYGEYRVNESWCFVTGVETDPIIPLHPGILARMRVYEEPNTTPEGA